MGVSVLQGGSCPQDVGFLGWVSRYLFCPSRYISTLMLVTSGKLSGQAPGTAQQPESKVHCLEEGPGSHSLLRPSATPRPAAGFQAPCPECSLLLVTAQLTPG